MTALPLEVTEQISRLGSRIRLARMRRGWTVAQLASRAGINRNTLTALESGKPGVAISAYVIVLWLLGLDRTLESVAHPDTDVHGKTLESARRPQRVRRRTRPRDEYDF